MARLVAPVYGEALYELAVESGEGKLKELYDQVVALQRIFKDTPEFDVLMNHPKVTKEEKLRVVQESFQGRVADELTGLLDLLLRKDRYGELDGILEDFIAKVKAHENIGVAEVRSAVALSDAEKKALQEKLLSTTKYSKVEVNYSVDPSLIGGVVIRIGDRVVDSSIRTKLQELKREMLLAQPA